MSGDAQIEVLTAVAESETTSADLVAFQRAVFGAHLVRATATAESQRRVLWQQMIGDWLELKAAKSDSKHTRRNYAAAIGRWQEFLTTQYVDTSDGMVRTVELWEVEQSHVRAWQGALSEGRSDATVNHLLSCVSSFYSYVINEKRLVNGVEIDLFVDVLGRTRANPFKTGNLQRGRTEQYQRALPLDVHQYDQLLTWLESQAHTLAGARNLALILTYLHTGWRSAELLRMQWEHVRPSKAQPGSYVFAWRGKGAKHQDDVLPADCYHAIVGYLKLAGRWTPGAPDREEGLAPKEFVWLPIKETDMSGMRNGARVDPQAPISDKSALRILRTALRKAGIAHPERYRVHDLRHTHAHLLLAAGQGVHIVKERLHHSSLATTGIYAARLQRSDPLDTHTAQFRQLRLSGVV